jgi:hypothetical protein
MWLWAVLQPAITFLSPNMCVWPAPRFLGVVALLLLSASLLTMFVFLAALPASVYFGVSGLIYWPSESYPDRIQDKPVERIHKWAYVPE